MAGAYQARSGTVGRYKGGIAIGSAITVGLIFVASGAGKLPQQGEFLEIIFAWEPIRPFMVGFVNHWLPWVELVFGVLLVTGMASRFIASLAAGLIIGFIVNNLWMQSLGLGYASCGCFGVWERLFAGKISTAEALYLDIGMLALVSIILLFYPARFFGVYPWFLKKDRVRGGI